MKYFIPFFMLICGCLALEQSQGTAQDQKFEQTVEQSVGIVAQLLGLLGGPVGQVGGAGLTALLGTYLGWRRRNLTLKSVIGSIEAARSSLPPEVQAQVFAEIGKKMPPRVKDVVRDLKERL